MQARHRDKPDSYPPDVAPRSPETGDVASEVFHDHLILSSLRRLFIADGTARTTLSLRPLSHRGIDLQSLRPWAALLCRRLCKACANSISTRGWSTLSVESTGPSQSCSTSVPLPRSSNKSDASRFPTSNPECSTASQSDVACRKCIAALALPFLRSVTDSIYTSSLFAASDTSSFTFI